MSGVIDMVIKLARFRTLADMMERIGDVPYDRVRFHPPIGTATVADVERIRNKEGRSCELVEGILVEKTVGMIESGLAIYLASLMHEFVLSRNLGSVLAVTGRCRFLPNSCAFLTFHSSHGIVFPNARRRNSRSRSSSPNLAVEVLSKSNTRKEMAIKRQEYFDAGVEIVWEIDPKKPHG